MLADADGHLRQKLQQVLKLSKEKFDDARDHAMRAVVADNRMRIWYVDKSNMEVGLLFTCRLGNVDLERPVGALRNADQLQELCAPLQLSKGPVSTSPSLCVGAQHAVRSPEVLSATATVNNDSRCILLDGAFPRHKNVIDLTPCVFCHAGLLQKKAQDGTQTTMEATLMAQQTPGQREQVRCKGYALVLQV